MVFESGKDPMYAVSLPVSYCPGSSSGTGHVGHISHSGAQCTLGDPPWGLRRNLSVDILFVIQNYSRCIFSKYG